MTHLEILLQEFSDQDLPSAEFVGKSSTFQFAVDELNSELPLSKFKSNQTELFGRLLYTGLLKFLLIDILYREPSLYYAKARNKEIYTFVKRSKIDIDTSNFALPSELSVKSMSDELKALPKDDLDKWFEGLNSQYHTHICWIESDLLSYLAASSLGLFNRVSKPYR